jgi:hypothetical protein
MVIHITNQFEGKSEQMNFEDLTLEDLKVLLKYFKSLTINVITL